MNRMGHISILISKRLMDFGNCLVGDIVAYFVLPDKKKVSSKIKKMHFELESQFFVGDKHLLDRRAIAEIVAVFFVFLVISRYPTMLPYSVL